MISKFNSTKASDLIIPESCKTIGATAFKGLALITKVVVPDSVTTIGKNAFEGCNSIEEITIPFVGDNETSTNTFSYIFNGKVDSIKKVTITNDITIPESAFREWSNIEKITIPTEVEIIGSSAFSGCTNLKQLNSEIDGIFNIPENVTVINSNVFYNCVNAKEITLGEVEKIDYNAFYNCSMISKFNSKNEKELIIPNSCETIGSAAFNGLALITKVVVPDSVTTIGQNAFGGCNSIEEITLPFVGYKENLSNDSSYRTFGYIFGSSTNNDSKYIPSTIKKVTITKQSIIPSNAFYNCSNIEEIYLINCIDSEGSNAYYNCNAKIEYSINPTSSSTWNGSLVGTSYHAGNGTENDPYQIFSPKEFIYFINQINNGENYENKYFDITSNLNFGNYNINSIGVTIENSFKGILNGKGHYLYNFNVSQSSNDLFNGLFGYVDGTIKNIGFRNAKFNYNSTITDKDVYVGLIVGQLNGYMENVYAYGNLTSKATRTIYSGGLVGQNNGNIVNTYTNVTVNSTSVNMMSYAGGLVGSNNGNINGCFAYGNVLSKGYVDSFSYASGLVGIQENNGKVTNSFRYIDQIITKFNSVSTSYNDIGDLESLDNIIEYCKNNWDSNIWSYKKSLPLF